MKLPHCRRRRQFFKLAKYFGACFGLILILIQLNTLSNFNIQNFFDPLVYPLRGNVIKYVNQLHLGITPKVPPINSYNYPFLISNDSKCLDSTGKPEKLKLLILIKSSLRHRSKRRVIRETWGQEDQFPHATLRIAFLLGVNPRDKELQEKIEKESKKYGDVIQSDFMDTYRNITVKTMQGMKWVVEKCKFAQFIFFCDDDVYVSVTNLLNLVDRFINTENYFYVGRVMPQLTPARNLSDKFYVSVKNYPYTNYPAYISGCAYVVNYKTLLRLFYGSMYTKHFIFEDVYLGIVAQKVNLPITHNDDFLLKKKVDVYDMYTFKSVIASHGFHNTTLLIKVWKEQEILSFYSN